MIPQIEDALRAEKEKKMADITPRESREGRDVAFRNMIANALQANPDFPLPTDHTARRAVRLAYRLERLVDVKALAETREEEGAVARRLENVSEALTAIYGSLTAAVLALARPLGELQQRAAEFEAGAALAAPASVAPTHFTTEGVRAAVENRLAEAPQEPGLLAEALDEAAEVEKAPDRGMMSPYSRGWYDRHAGADSRSHEESDINSFRYAAGWEDAEARMARSAE